MAKFGKDSSQNPDPKDKPGQTGGSNGGSSGGGSGKFGKDRTQTGGLGPVGGGNPKGGGSPKGNGSGKFGKDRTQTGGLSPVGRRNPGGNGSPSGNRIDPGRMNPVRPEQNSPTPSVDDLARMAVGMLGAIASEDNQNHTEIGQTVTSTRTTTPKPKPVPQVPGQIDPNKDLLKRIFALGAPGLSPTPSNRIL